MSESRTGTSAAGPSGGRSEHDRDHEEFQAGTGYQPSTNQARDEPVPASHHDEGRQEAGGRPGWPGSGRWPGGQAGRRAGRQLGRIVLIPVLLLAAAGLLVVSLVSSGTAGKRGCGHAAAAVMLPGLSRVATGTSGSGRAACPAGSPQPTAGSR